MFSNVVMSTSVLSTTKDLDQVGAIASFADDGGRCHRFLVSLRTDTVWLAKNGGFLWQPHWLQYFVLWVVHWLRWSCSALACGSVYLICCGTAVHSTHWYNISAGEHKWASIGVLQYASRAKIWSWPEHLAQVSNPLTVFMAASAWPLLLGFLGELVLWSNFQSVANLVKSALANWGPLSVWSTYWMPCSVKSSFRTEMVLEALHWDAGIILIMGILE